MKILKMILVLGLVVTTGCTLPKHIADTIRVPRLKQSGIPVAQLAEAIEVRSQGSKQIDVREVNRVLVLARHPEEAVWREVSRYSSAARPTLSAHLRHVTEAAAQEALLDRGFRAATRMSDIPVTKEASYLDDNAFSVAEGGLFRGEMILILTVNALTIERSTYRATTWDGTYDADIGYRVQGHLSAELVGNSSETFWVGTAKIDRLVQEEITTDELLDILVQGITKGIPTKG